MFDWKAILLDDDRYGFEMTRARLTDEGWAVDYRCPRWYEVLWYLKRVRRYKSQEHKVWFLGETDL